jgi:hypothetical protein
VREPGHILPVSRSTTVFSSNVQEPAIGRCVATCAHARMRARRALPVCAQHRRRAAEHGSGLVILEQRASQIAMTECKVATTPFP